MILPSIYNLFKQHPKTICLIHKNDALDAQMDPYDFNSLLQDSNALESSLWELELIKTHYNPIVSQMALIFQESLANPIYDVEDFMDHSYRSLMDTEFNARKQREAMMHSNYQSPEIMILFE